MAPGCGPGCLTVIAKRRIAVLVSSLVAPTERVAGGSVGARSSPNAQREHAASRRASLSFADGVDLVGALRALRSEAPAP